MVERVFVLGIDPGLSRCGYGAVRRVRGGSGSGSGGMRAEAAGILTTAVGDPLPKRLAALARDVRSLIDELRPDVVAVERLLFQANARTAMAVGQASGLVLAAAAEAGCDVVQYSPNEVKQAVTGYGAAPKEQVQRMVQALLGLGARPRPPDTADALALAICHLAAAPLLARASGAAQ